MELRQIELFVVLARHRNFTRAAEAVGMAQPALSLQVKRLERELGMPLLDRSTRPVQLTEAGATFLALLHAVPGHTGVDGTPAGIVLERLFDEQLVVVVPPSHPLAGQSSVTLANLRNEPFVLVAHGS